MVENFAILLGQFAQIAQREHDTGTVEYWPAVNPKACSRATSARNLASVAAIEGRCRIARIGEPLRADARNLLAHTENGPVNTTAPRRVRGGEGRRPDAVGRW
ncbi:hypothetical protein ACQP0C_21280 [Nocardia sp. CA-129566]|uniref:hypothetical protein n=1 Tax=Nocardia sp. CA-129566 TaxID=3239976 RepID=UPI003D979F60